MSEAYECDRCGSLCSDSPHANLQTFPGEPRTRHGESHKPNDPIGVRTRTLDLCRGCLDELASWYGEGGGAPSDVLIEDGKNDE